MCNCKSQEHLGNYGNCKECCQTKPTPHIHAAFIKAWADGYKIQTMNGKGEWVDVISPTWFEDNTYRINPEPKPDIITTAVMEFKHAWKSPSIRVSFGDRCPAGYAHNLSIGLDVIQFTFDGETGKLKKVEML